jgi:SAM-dependent methyltransferase
MILIAGALVAGGGLMAGGWPALLGQTRTPDVVYVGTPYDVVSRMLKMARVKRGDVLYDLGCGDGRMLVLAAQKYGCRGFGFDIDAERVNAAQENARRNRVAHLVNITEADLFTVDIGDADVLMLYLLPEMNTKLLPKFRKLRPGSRLVFHNYDLEGIEADESIRIVSNEDGAGHTLFLYTIPLRETNSLLPRK